MCLPLLPLLVAGRRNVNQKCYWPLEEMVVAMMAVFSLEEEISPAHIPLQADDWTSATCTTDGGRGLVEKFGVSFISGFKTEITPGSSTPGGRFLVQTEKHNPEYIRIC